VDLRSNNFNLTRLLTAYFVLLAHSYALLGVLDFPVFSKLDYSYGIYICAFPVQHALVATWPEMEVATYIMATTVITIVLAAFSW